MVVFDDVVDFTDKWVLNPKYALWLNVFLLTRMDREFLKNSNGALNLLRNFVGEWRRVRAEHKRIAQFLYLLLWKRLHNRFQFKVSQRAEPSKIVWSQQSVVVTGGADGMGAALVDLLARRGAKVAALDVSDKSKYRAKSPVLIHCDVSDEESVKKAAAEVEQAIGAPTILVNAAGVLLTGPLASQTSKVDEKMIKINLLGSLYTIRAFVPHMIKRNKGHIVQFASGAAYATLPLLGGYCASKAGVTALMEGLQYDLETYHKTDKVRTSTVFPLKVQTELGKSMKDSRNQFMQPTLERQFVARKVLEILESDQNHVSFFPYIGNALPALRVMPRWLARKITDGAKYSFWTDADYDVARVPIRGRK